MVHQLTRGKREDEAALTQHQRKTETEPINQDPHNIPSSLQLIRKSTRLKTKQPIQYLTGAPLLASNQLRSSLLRAGINFLIQNFPYSLHTDNEIVNMFTNCGFSLGTTDKTRLKVVQHFRTLTQQNLLTVLHGILDKIDFNNTDNIDIDLSTKILPLRSLISK
jgi:hypothetical protein